MSAETPRRDPFGYTNTWLADMGYATWRLVLTRRGIPMDHLPEMLQDTAPEMQDAWRFAAAAIRRRVVKFRLPAEETDGDNEALQAD